MLLKEKFDQLGWLTEIIDLGSQSGPCLKVLNKPSEKYDVMLLGHMDTVFPRGTVAARPFKLPADTIPVPAPATAISLLH